MLLNMKTGKKMMKGGFMCHSSAECMSRSIVVPPSRRPVHRTNYIRLGDQRPMKTFPPRSSLKKDQQKMPHETSNFSTSTTSHNLFQVVVMRVSIHCQGCAGKVKKHLSKMEGTYPYF
ncbi:hypothetical protein ACS0TY_011679 [Phlomoides rotata]